MALQEIELELTSYLPQSLTLQAWIAACRSRIESYWDQFAKQPLPQYVECDFDLVGAALEACMIRQLVDGHLFVEWGCGFAVVTGIAALLGLDAVGIEAESMLCIEGGKLLEKHGIKAEVWQGNFLPGGASQLAEETDPLVSLTHTLPPAYEHYGLSLDDFAIIFAYPWPGEEHFLRHVFDRYARGGALLLMFRGPNHVELFRKRSQSGSFI